MPNMMPTRVTSLHEAMAGLEKTGVPLIGFDGKLLKPLGFSDGLGTYYIIPQIAHTLNISIYDASMVFYLAWGLTSLLAGLAGSLLLFSHCSGKFISVAALILLSIIVFKHGFAYAFPASSVVSTIPLFIYFCKKGRMTPGFLVFCFIAGISLGVSHYIRIHSGTGVLLFFTIALIFYFRADWIKKGLLAGAITIGVLIPVIYSDALLQQRNDFLASQANHHPVAHKKAFWHLVYIGFGYLHNDLDLQFIDEVAIEKVRSISPNAIYLSREYNEILKRSTIKLVKENPIFALKTVVVKAGRILFCMLVFANIGLLAAIKYPKPLGLEAAFIVGMVFQSIPGILVMPIDSYLLGFIAMATIYGVLSINEALDKGCQKDFLELLQRTRKVN